MIGDRIKMLRCENNLTMKQMAEQFGITISAWNKYEKGNAEPNIQTLIGIADYFNVSLDFLLCRTNLRDLQLVETANMQNDFLKEFEETTIGDPSKFYGLFENLAGFLQLLKSEKITEQEAQLLLSTISDIVVYENDLHSLKETHNEIDTVVFGIHAQVCADTLTKLHKILELAYVPKAEDNR